MDRVKDRRAKEILRKQLELLAELSQRVYIASELSELTAAMVKIAEKL